VKLLRGWKKKGRWFLRMKEKEKSMEEAFEELNELLTKMDSDQISLEDSFKLYQEGVQLVRYCNEKIDKVEKQLMILNEMGEENGG
jgi:exodeoxyribonuclease VII small subunit